MNIQEIIKNFSRELPDAFLKQKSTHIPDLPGAAKAITAAALQNVSRKTILIISDGPKSLETIHRDADTLCTSPENTVLYYPPREIISAPTGTQDPGITGHRLLTLNTLLNNQNNPVITTCIQAMMQKIPSPKSILLHTVSLSLNQEADLDQTKSSLSQLGFEFTGEVVEKGQASSRGGLLDVWPCSQTWPLRIEFFGSTVESIRTFDPATQISIERLNTAVILPCSDNIPPQNSKQHDDFLSSSLLAYLPPDTIFLWPDMESTRQHAKNYEESIAETAHLNSIIPFKNLRSQITRREQSLEIFAGDSANNQNIIRDFNIKPIPQITYLPRETFNPDIAEQARFRMLSDIASYTQRGFTTVFFFDTKGSIEHFAGSIPASFNAPHGMFDNLLAGSLSHGFICESAKLIVITETDLYGRRKTEIYRYNPGSKTAGPDNTNRTHITLLEDIRPGNLVIHIEHGLGKYLGINEITFNGQPQEALTIEYADNAKLHVPVCHIHLLSKYVGISHANTRLHKLGGKRWIKEKESAEQSIQDLASSLLETQAQRNIMPGFSFSRDHKWQHQFESSFPYRETTDQIIAINAVKKDMESPHPMDRLICGDAGYGKTEVAMRAAFKAVTNHKQVAILVPTTVLAQQHFDTFTERMRQYPVRVEMLSRFCARNRIPEIISDLKSGAVDIIIGTHALLQPGISFKDLGLVIIDEEQRFGVAHKEQLKHFRKLVDVLTMTATPIPRTLYMGMTGSREMSLIQTPPGERMAIETIITANTDNTVREAIIKELNREGQVFYIHNRVLTIERIKNRLQKIVPEARITVAHGRMSTSTLSSTMQKFVDGESDVLLCTTIVESGMDIPRANTIMIDRADRFGIADLYQLRGRVGRSNRKAYAYLLLPPHGQSDPEGQIRVSALKRHSGLSAGFNLALRDLELRGAGNLLGAEQSGHINDIGFSLYCQLLRRTIARLKGKPMPELINIEINLDFISLSPRHETNDNSAIIPVNYIQNEQQRISTYRKMAETTSLQDVKNLNREMKDRFGPIPPAVNRLLKIAELRIIAASHKIQNIETRDGKVLLLRNNDYLKCDNKFPRLSKSSPDNLLEELINLVKSIPAPKNTGPST